MKPEIRAIAITVFIVFVITFGAISIVLTPYIALILTPIHILFVWLFLTTEYRRGKLDGLIEGKRIVEEIISEVEKAISKGEKVVPRKAGKRGEANGNRKRM